MKPDPILRELWAAKDGLAKECGNDLRRLFEKLKASQQHMGAPVIDRTKQRARQGVAR